MKKGKVFYFENDDSEMCYSESYFQDKMKEENLNSMTVFEAVKSKDKSFIWCKEAMTCGEHSECGKFCDDYAPKNGKNGCCKHRCTMYEMGFQVELIRQEEETRNE